MLGLSHLALSHVTSDLRALALSLWVACMAALPGCALLHDDAPEASEEVTNQVQVANIRLGTPASEGEAVPLER